MSSTRVVLADAAATHDLSAVGLGAEDSANAHELTADQRERRRALIDLRDRVHDLARDGDDEFTPAELAVYVSATDATAGVEPTPWPLEEPLSEGGTPIDPDRRCLHITRDTTTVLAAARAAADPTWISAGQTWNVLIRPLLPHEHACPDP